MGETRNLTSSKPLADQSPCSSAIRNCVPPIMRLFNSLSADLLSWLASGLPRQALSAGFFFISLRQFVALFLERCAVLAGVFHFIDFLRNVYAKAENLL